MAEACIGARIKYCWHEGYFVADICKVGNVNVVRANGPVTPDNIIRDAYHNLHITHKLIDFPTTGFWNPKIGIFVVPEEQVIKLSKENV